MPFHNNLQIRSVLLLMEAKNIIFFSPILSILLSCCLLPTTWPCLLFSVLVGDEVP